MGRTDSSVAPCRRRPCVGCTWLLSFQDLEAEGWHPDTAGSCRLQTFLSWRLHQFRLCLPLYVIGEGAWTGPCRRHSKRLAFQSSQEQDGARVLLSLLVEQMTSPWLSKIPKSESVSTKAQAWSGHQCAGLRFISTGIEKDPAAKVKVSSAVVIHACTTSPQVRELW
ncbi:hypothetical protein LEMLEM_LOCUS14308 [Lemmus lemmus]